MSDKRAVLEKTMRFRLWLVNHGCLVYLRTWKIFNLYCTLVQVAIGKRFMGRMPSGIRKLILFPLEVLQQSNCRALGIVPSPLPDCFSSQVNNWKITSLALRKWLLSGSMHIARQHANDTSL